MNLRMATAFLAALTTTLITTTTRRTTVASAFSRSVVSSTARRRANVSISSADLPPRSRLSSTAGPSTSTSTSTKTDAASDDVVVAVVVEENDETSIALDSLKSSFLTTMRDRGFLHQCTDLSSLDAILHDAETSSPAEVGECDDDIGAVDGDGADGGGAEKKTKTISAYLGFDATADSLHVGSLLQIMILRHLQNSGHRPIVLIGGGTSKVGDPTGKDESRMLLTDDVIKANTDGISRVFRKFLSFGPTDEDGRGGDENGSEDQREHSSRRSRPNDAIMVNNDEWLSSLKYLQFLRDFGTHFTINRMLGFESVKQRLSREAPFSFLEFNYMILQAYDFLELYRRHGALLQLGGSDQWGNMISGVELGRRVDSARLYALTAPLITTSDGKKMGKTAGGAVWLNADRLSEYDYWQFWRNTDDSDVIRFLKLFTELPLEEIRKMESWTGADINKAKIVLADEATALLHGRECLRGIRDTVDGMFGGGAGGGGGEGSTEGLNRVYVSEDEITGGADGGAGGVKIADLFVRLGLASSKKEAKRLIAGGGARIGDTKITDENATLGVEAFVEGNKDVTLRAGKKRAGVVELEK
ncbi:hypothetical protein ACHAXA_006832 [Cyclostephanos tholiformis]|uniref:Tyrosine--tRNA ligase n=1 Tax=Cyclostephanos tholiformis TaxID=382380 RepID=A0ABD3REM9_9STRA